MEVVIEKVGLWVEKRDETWRILIPLRMPGAQKIPMQHTSKI